MKERKQEVNKEKKYMQEVNKERNTCKNEIKIKANKKAKQTE